MIKSFQGGVFSGTLPDGRAAAQIEVSPGGVSAVTGDSHRFTVSFEEMSLEKGGASGRMIFCRNRDQSITIFCEDKGFPIALEENARGPAKSAIDTLHSQGKRSRRTRWGILLASLAVLVGLGYAVVPLGHWTARQLIHLVPTTVDEKLGEVGWTMMGGGMRAMGSKPANDALRKIVDRLERHTKASKWNFRVQLTDDPMVNAFALPGGRIIVCRGLIERSDNPEEVAGVLAHEMAHVIERHGLQRVAQQIGVVGVIQLLFGDVGGVLVIAKELLTMTALNQYSQGQESAADARAVRIMNDSGLDPLALAHFFERLEKESGSVPKYMQWMSSHPSHEDCIRAVQKLVPKRKPSRPLAIDWKSVQRALREEKER